MPGRISQEQEFEQPVYKGGIWGASLEYPELMSDCFYKTIQDNFAKHKRIVLFTSQTMMNITTLRNSNVWKRYRLLVKGRGISFV